MKIRRSNERGHFNHGWLDSYHTFSFADYHDPEWMGFRSLRVINEDFVEAGQGFQTHAHRDMEIITYVLKGALSHKDSMGNGSTILPGDVQYMSAGRGVTHSEFNLDKASGVHLFQIWILPKVKGADPRYDQKHFDRASKINKWCLLVSQAGEDASLAIRQDAKIFVSILEAGKKLRQPASETGRYFWIQVLKGQVVVGGQRLDTGDAALVEPSGGAALDFEGGLQETEILLFSLV